MNFLKISVCLYLINTLGWAQSPSPIPNPIPFWKAKPDVYARLKEERAIIVSARDENEGEKKKLILVSAGLIHAPENFVYDRITEYEKYPGFVSYIKETSFDKTTNNIFVHGALLGYHVNMTIHLNPEKTPEGHKIRWESISGGFVGMKGTVTQESTDSDHTEISMNLVYVAESLGLPAFILNWGLEYASRQACSSIRTHIEDEWAKSTKNH